LLRVTLPPELDERRKALVLAKIECSQYRAVLKDTEKTIAGKPANQAELEQLADDFKAEIARLEKEIARLSASTI
jgi:hypothetical protein